MLSNAVPETLPPLVISAKAGPKFPQDAVFETSLNTHDQYTNCPKILVLSRKLGEDWSLPDHLSGRARRVYLWDLWVYP